MNEDLKALLDANIKVIPLRRGDKIPAISGWQQKASCDYSQIEEWMKQYPGCNWGMPTGEINGLIVIDIDTHGGDGINSLREWCKENGKFPFTLCQKTPTGGYHLIYRSNNADLRNRARTNGVEGVDVRWKGGQVVVCPSTRSMGAYVWLTKEQTLAELEGILEGGN